MEVPDLGKSVVGVRVQAPLEHVALHDQGTGELAFPSPLLARPDVDHEAAFGHDPPQLVRAHAPDASACPLDQVVHGNAHATASPNRYRAVAPASSPASVSW